MRNKLLFLIIFLISGVINAQVVNWGALSGSVPETGYSTSSFSVVGDGATYVSLDLSRTNSGTVGGAINAVAPSQVLTNSFNNARTSVGISGNTYTYVFSEPVYVTLSSLEHSDLIRTENIKISSANVGANFSGSIVGAQSSHFLNGNNSSSVHIGSSDVTMTTGGTYWEVKSTVAITSMTVEYYVLDGTEIADAEPFTMNLSPLPYIRLDDTNITGAGGINMNSSACSTGWEMMDNTNTGGTITNLVSGQNIASMTVTLTNPQDIGQEELTMAGGFTGVTVTGNNTTSVTIISDGTAPISSFRSALDDIYYVDNALNPNTVVTRLVDVTFTDVYGNTSNTATCSFGVTRGAKSGLSTGAIVVFTGDPAFDLFTGLDGSQDAGGTWVDVDATGALTLPSTVNVAVLPLGGSVFRYNVAGVAPCGNASTTVVVIKMNGSEVPLTSATSCAQLMTSYTNPLYSGNSDDAIYVFTGGSGELTSELGGVGTIYDWYVFNATTNSYDIHALNSTPTQSGLADGGYLVVRNDGGTIEEGRAWVWNSSLNLDAGAPQTVCAGDTVSLAGAGTITNPSYTYYDPVPRPLIIDATTQITVTFDGVHTYVSDLGFFAVAPDLTTTVTLGPNQGNTCNAGDNITGLAFTSNPVASVFNFCAPVVAPLAGVYDQYFDGVSTFAIDWSPFYGMNARDGGWAVQIYDCVGADTGSLTGAVINFDDGFGNVVTYTSGAISVPINDNSCTPATASIYVVPFTAPTPGIDSSISLNGGVGVGGLGGYEWSLSTTGPGGPWTGPFENNTLTPSIIVNETTWFRVQGDNGVGCLSEDVVQINTQIAPAAGTDNFISFEPTDSSSNLFALLGVGVDVTGNWSGPSILAGGNLGTFDPTTNADGIYTYTIPASGSCLSASAQVTVLVNAGQPSLSLEKTSVYVDTNGNGIIDVGDTVNYAFSIENTGNINLTNIVITDPLVGVVITGSPIAGPLAPGAIDTSATGSYIITAGDITTGSLSNQATATADSSIGVGTATDTSDDPTNTTDNDSNGDGEPDDVTVTDLTQPNLSLEKTSTYVDLNGNGFIDAGDRINYVFNVINTGNTDLFNVTITDPLIGIVMVGTPIPTLVVGANDNTTYSATYIITGADVVAAGVTNQATVTGEDLASGGTVVASDTSDDPTNATDNDANGDGEPDDATVTDLSQPNLSIEKTATYADTNGNGVIDAGDTMSYVFNVINTGNVVLFDVTVTDALPGIVMVGAPIANLAVGANDNTTYSATYVITAADVTAGNVSNQAVATGASVASGPVTATDTSDDPTNTTDADANGDGEPDDVTVFDLSQPNISLEKTATYVDSNGNGVIDAGDTINYVFNVINTGNINLTNVTVNDALVTVIGGPLASLPVGMTNNTTFSASYVITEVDMTNGSVTNQATVNANSSFGLISDLSDDPTDSTDNDNNGDGDPDDATVTDLSQGGISLLKEASFDDGGDGYADVGDIITYTFTLNNTGNTPITNIVLEDPMLGGIISGPDFGDDNSNNELNVVETWIYTVDYYLTQADIEAEIVINSAFVVGDDFSGNPLTDLSDDPTDNTDDDIDGDGTPDDETVIELIVNMELTFNNGVTPDGDGVNDTFTIGGIQYYPNNQMHIYNRWGVLVYEARGYNNTSTVFIGESEGRVTIKRNDKLPTGTYFYVLHYTDDGSGKVNKKAGYLYINNN